MRYLVVLAVLAGISIGSAAQAGESKRKVRVESIEGSVLVGEIDEQTIKLKSDLGTFSIGSGSVINITHHENHDYNVLPGYQIIYHTMVHFKDGCQVVCNFETPISMKSSIGTIEIDLTSVKSLDFPYESGRNEKNSECRNAVEKTSTIGDTGIDQKQSAAPAPAPASRGKTDSSIVVEGGESNRKVNETEHVKKDQTTKEHENADEDRDDSDKLVGTWFGRMKIGEGELDETRLIFGLRSLSIESKDKNHGNSTIKGSYETDKIGSNLKIINFEIGSTGVPELDVHIDETPKEIRVMSFAYFVSKDKLIVCFSERLKNGDPFEIVMFHRVKENKEN